MLIITSQRITRRFSDIITKSTSKFCNLTVMNEVQENLRRVRQQMDDIKPGVCLVAVSKTKPPEAIRTLYDIGHKHFGENYVQELLSKVAILPSDICWHFIGHLQSQKAKQLIEGVPNLYLLESLDSQKLANKLNKVLQSQEREPLRVYIQVNTSLEDTKSGITFDNAVDLAIHVRDHCPYLILAGLMTIGAPNDSSCFDTLVECRQKVGEALSVDPSTLDLSMGMSGDYQDAIHRGATSVRVGSVIFGNREYGVSS